jgi:predicted TPR repeat methyltransferase
MEEFDSIGAHDREAGEYDQQVVEYKCFAHDAVFGMCYEYVRPGERLLDMGIGTGLSSAPFARAGVQVHGFDGSGEMLRVCESKGYAKELRQFDLRELPLPYPDATFDHVISHGVFHFFGDLEAIFKEVSRVIKPGGIFAFSVALQTPKDDNRQDFKKLSGGGATIFMHNEGYMERLFESGGFKWLKELKFLIRSWLEDADDLTFIAYVVRKD